MKNLFVLSLILVLFGCAQKPVAFKDAKGKENYFISCPPALGMNFCYQQAAKQCPNGFSTLDRSDRTNALSESAARLNGLQGDSLTISCN